MSEFKWEDVSVRVDKWKRLQSLCEQLEPHEHYEGMNECRICDEPLTDVLIRHCETLLAHRAQPPDTVRVPVEPTEEMLKAAEPAFALINSWCAEMQIVRGRKVNWTDDNPPLKQAWRAMLAVTPRQPEAQSSDTVLDRARINKLLTRCVEDCVEENRIKAANTISKILDAASPRQPEAQPAEGEAVRYAPMVKAAQEFIAKVDRGEARSKRSYAAFKAALDAITQEQKHE